MSAPATPGHGGRPRLAGVAGAVAAAVGVWLVARYGVGMQLRTPGFTSMQYSASSCCSPWERITRPM
jgi:hypothetical protein